MKKKKLIIVLLIVALTSIVLVIRFKNQQYTEDVVQYDNLFEYAVDLNKGEYMYSPRRLTYGMSKENVLYQEHLTNYEENEWGNVSYTKRIRNVSEKISDVRFTKSYVFGQDNSGLVRVQYIIILGAEEAGELLKMLYKQAKDYMPQPQQGTMPGIEVGEHVEWCDYIFESEKKKSAVRFNAETDVTAEKTIIVLTVEICS